MNPFIIEFLREPTSLEAIDVLMAPVVLKEVMEPSDLQGARTVTPHEGIWRLVG